MLRGTEGAALDIGNVYLKRACEVVVLLETLSTRWSLLGEIDSYAASISSSSSGV